jgi:hypothetical protein
MKMLRVALAGVALSLGIAGTVSDGQRSPFPSQQQPSNPMGQPSPIGPAEPVPPQVSEQQERSRNNDRQKRLVADTDKLLSLATELKQQVDKTNKDVMSVDVIKKADEIEKLAHSVKERMKG